MLNDPAPAEDEVAPQGAAPKTEAAEDEKVDPAAELAARFDSIEAELARLKGLDTNAVKSALGRISSLQSTLDDLSKRNPLADIDPRVSASEGALVTLAQTFLNEPGISDAARASISNAILGVENARTQREQETRERALEARLRAELAPTQTQSAEPTDEVLQATNARLIAQAARLGIDPASVPWGDLQTQAGGSLSAAEALATDWMYEHRPDDSAARTRERQTAAGRGSPKRDNAARTLEQERERLRDGALPMTETETRKKLAAELGVPLPY